MIESSIELTSQENDIILGYLKRLGLNSDQANLYIYLHVLGPSTVVALSKAIGTGRTRLYPVLESLHELGLVVIHEKHYGTKYEALSPQSLEYLVAEIETKSQQLRTELSSVQNAIAQLSGSVTKGSKVIEYKGIEGLKQINFNLTKAHKECRVFELAHLDEHSVLPKSFVDRIRKAFVDNNIINRDITNNKEWKFVENPYDPQHKYQRGCYISSEIFPIEVETYIYNDCIAYLQYSQDNIFGVEIHNELLANQQKHLFDIVWNQGKEIR